MKTLFRDGLLLTFFFLMLIGLIRLFPGSLNDKGAAWMVIICSACMALVAIGLFDNTKD